MAAPQRRRPARRRGRANNVAEYRALLAGLEHASGIGLDRVDVRCDARLVVEQVSGGRAPVNPRLRELCGAVREAAERIGTVVFTWVPAEANGDAHALVAEALDTQMAMTDDQLTDGWQSGQLFPGGFERSAGAFTRNHPELTDRASRDP